MLIQILIIIGIIAIAPLSIILMIWIKKSQTEGTKKSTDKKKTRKITSSVSRDEIEEQIGIHEIKNNLQKQKDGGYSVVLEYTTPDYGTLKNEEQNLFEAKLARAVISMDRKFKIVEFSGNLKTVKANHKIQETINKGILTDEATAYAKKLAKSLNDKRFDMTSLEKKKYIVLGSYQNTEEECIEDLKRQVKRLVTNFGKADTHMKLLETTDLIHLENELINYNTKLDIRTIEEQGIFELFSTGGRAL